MKGRQVLSTNSNFPIPGTPPLELTLRQVITAADNVQDQEILENTPSGVKALAALWLVKTLGIQHIPVFWLLDLQYWPTLSS